jgi:hypothetical protein
MTAREVRARLQIFEAFAMTGAPPPVVDEEAVAGLAAQHVVVMEPGTRHIRMAHPFAAHRDGTEVRAGVRRWWGNCAWDGLGIVAALGLRDADLLADGHEIAVRQGRLVEADLLFHVAVPAARWWEDIGYT